MPLKLVPPRKGKTPNFYVRGSYLGNEVFESTRTGERRVANLYLKRLQGQIERGEFGTPKGPTFEDGVTAYVQAGGEKRFLEPLLHHFKERALSSIDQKAIDDAAQELYPNATNATRNRQVHTPVRAILKRSNIPIELQRPIGALGATRTEWLWPDQAFALFKEAKKIDPRFETLLIFLTYTGCRLSEALDLEWQHVRLDERIATVAETKPGSPRTVFLPPITARHLANLYREAHGPERRGDHSDFVPPAPSSRVFRLTKSGRLYLLLKKAKTAAGLPGVNFHMLRHTWATWMRKYGKVDTRGLIATGAWNDSQAAERYQHVVVSEEARKAALLPTEDDDQ